MILLVILNNSFQGKRFLKKKKKSVKQYFFSQVSDTMGDGVGNIGTHFDYVLLLNKVLLPFLPLLWMICLFSPIYQVREADRSSSRTSATQSKMLLICKLLTEPANQPIKLREYQNDVSIEVNKNS